MIETIVAVLGLFISLCNSLYIVRQNRIRLKLSRVTIISLDRSAVFVEFDISNRSALPLSVNAASIVSGGHIIVGNKVRNFLVADNQTMSGGHVTSRRRFRISTELPLTVDPFLSKHIVLEFPCRDRLCRFLQRRQPSILLRLHTSRGSRTLRARAVYLDPKTWLSDLETSA